MKIASVTSNFSAMVLLALCAPTMAQTGATQTLDIQTRGPYGQRPFDGVACVQVMVPYFKFLGYKVDGIEGFVYPKSLRVLWVPSSSCANTTRGWTTMRIFRSPQPLPWDPMAGRMTPMAQIGSDMSTPTRAQCPLSNKRGTPCEKFSRLPWQPWHWLAF